MAVQKNALREHWIQDYIPGTEEPVEASWVELAHRIATITDSTSLESESTAWYSGDGTPEVAISSISEKWDASGQYDPEDPAQKLIASKKREVGDGRKIWHKVIEADRTNQYIGRATLADNVVCGSGDASAFQEFSCGIQFDEIPKKEAVTPTP